MQNKKAPGVQFRTRVISAIGILKTAVGKRSENPARAEIPVAQKIECIHPVLGDTADLPVNAKVINSLLGRRWNRPDSPFVALDIGKPESIIVFDVRHYGGSFYFTFMKDLVSQGYRPIRQYQMASDLLRILLKGDLADQELDVGESSTTSQEFFQNVEEAFRLGSSDMHLELRGSAAQVRFRIDGRLIRQRPIDGEIAEKMIRYSLTKGADPNNRPPTFNPKVPQDAAITRRIAGQTITLRVGTTPAHDLTGTGQDAVYRILNNTTKKVISTRINELGYLSEQEEMLHASLLSPYGFNIIAGTTGSGKSTLLSTMLTLRIQLTDGTEKVITVELPVEYPIPGATQIPVTAQSGTENPFSPFVRGAMRLDPDVLMIGEINDQITAEAAQHFAITGHPLFSTVHVFSAFAIPARLADVGVDRAIMGIPGIFSLLAFQCLLPKLCPHCRIPFRESPLFYDGALVSRLRHIGVEIEAVWTEDTNGCEFCGNGTKGRTVAAEMFVPNTHMVGLFREDRVAEAARYYLGTKLKHAVAKTSLGHAVRRMNEGIVSPTAMITAFGPDFDRKVLELIEV